MKKLLSTLLIVTLLLLNAEIVGAATKIFVGEGKYAMSDFENPEIAQQRAIQLAKQDAQNKSVAYLMDFSQSVNVQLTLDENSAITNNAMKIFNEKATS